MAFKTIYVQLFEADGKQGLKMKLGLNKPREFNSGEELKKFILTTSKGLHAPLPGKKGIYSVKGRDGELSVMIETPAEAAT